MILVDDRAGSGFGDVNNLVPILSRMGLPVRATRLKFGDVSFEGNGPGGRTITIGIEVKSVPDFLQSMKDGRLVGTQLPGLQRAYEMPWLMVHGEARPDPGNGVLQVNHPRWGWVKPHQTMMYKDIHKFLWTMKFVHRVEWLWAGSMPVVAIEIRGLYEWWNSKEWDDHQSGQAFDTSSEKTFLHQPSFARTVAKDLPGIGWKRSKDVIRAFPTMYDMAMAEESDWARVPGIGKVGAKRIYKAVRGHR